MDTKLVLLIVGVFLLIEPGFSMPLRSNDSRVKWEIEHWGVESINEDDDSQSKRIGRQFAGLGDLGKVVDSVGKFDLKEVSKFLKEIPELFESVQSIVDGADKSFGEVAEAAT